MWILSGPTLILVTLILFHVIMTLSMVMRNECQIDGSTEQQTVAENKMRVYNASGNCNHYHDGNLKRNGRSSFSNYGSVMDPISMFHRDKMLHHEAANGDNTLMEASLRLISVQSAYNLSVKRLSEGRLFNYSLQPLSTEDLVLIGTSAVENSLYEEALRWLHLADILLFGDPGGEEQEEPLESQKQSRAEISKREVFRKYSLQCQNEMKPMQAKLKCYHQRSSISYHYWKVEILSNDPLVVYYHDLIPDSTIAKLIEQSAGRFSGSEMVDDHGNLQTRYSRISESVWLEEPHNLITGLEKQIHDLTKLKASVQDDGESSSEKLQVAHYKPGGGYQPHYDFIGNLQADEGTYLQGSGDRLATFMYYLESPVIGGATVFPLLGIRALPNRGSALFWYNLKKSGVFDKRTLHAGCPVVIGNKTIANKWIREAGQMCVR